MLIRICFVLVLANSGTLAQASNTIGPASKSQSAVKTTSKSSRPEPEDLREHQLRVFRDHILSRTLDSIKKMDEAALRLSARNQILTYLSEKKPALGETKQLCNQIALDSLADLSSHGAEILPFMANYLSNDLGAWIQKYQPELTEKFQNAVKANRNIGESLRIRPLFDLKDGDVLAAQRIRQMLERQEALDGLFFWLDELMSRNSKELEPLMSEIVTRAKLGQVSFDTLFWVSEIYLRSRIPVGLRNRFVEMVVARTQPAHFVAEPAPQSAYDLLMKILPFVQQISPELYDQALNQSFAIRASLSENQLANEARTKRLRESINPIEDLVSEAESAKSKAHRNDLLATAAQLALDKQKFALCLDILAKIDLDVSASSPDFWRDWKSQFLRGFVSKALLAKDVDIAEKAVESISSPLTRVEAVVLMIRFLVKGNAKASAQRLFTEAGKIAAAVLNNTEKAKAFFMLSVMCDWVDESKKAELLHSGIKALNNLSRPDPKANNMEPYQQYVRSLDNTGHELTKGFKHLTKKDENSALALVEHVQKRDLRTFALIGILSGLEELLARELGKTRRNIEQLP